MGVSQDQGFRNHKLNGLTCLMQVYLPEEFLSPRKNDINIRKYFLIVSNLIIDNSSVLYDPFITNLRLINLGVN